MNRRDFLTISLQTEAPPKPAIKQIVPIITTPTAGRPRDYVRHSWVLIEDAHAWLVRDELGFYAIDATCPHLDGLLRPLENTLVCPCHGSAFESNGMPATGPAHHPLRYFMVDVDADGKLVIRRDQTVSPDDRFIA